MSVVRIFCMMMIGLCSFQSARAVQEDSLSMKEYMLRADSAKLVPVESPADDVESYSDARLNETDFAVMEDQQPFAREEDDDTAEPLAMRRAVEEDVAALRKMKALQYDRPKEEKERPEWLKSLAIWMVLHAREIKYFYYGLLGAIFILVVLAFLRKSDLGLFYRRNKKAGEAAEAEIEEGPQNYEALAQSAIAQGDFRSAIRMRYLQALQLLEGRSLIMPGKDKTNMEFLRELSTTAFHQPFSKLTRHYEYIWYGKVPLSSGQFAQLDEQFAEFKKSLR